MIAYSTAVAPSSSRRKRDQALCERFILRPPFREGRRRLPGGSRRDSPRCFLRERLRWRAPNVHRFTRRVSLMILFKVLRCTSACGIAPHDGAGGTLRLPAGSVPEPAHRRPGTRPHGARSG
jgi:hypothetical protein